MKNKLINKKMSVLLMLFILITATIVFAQNSQDSSEPSFETESDDASADSTITKFEEEETVEEEIVVESAGMTPDSPFYFVDEIMDKVEIATAEGEDKAEVAAEIAAEKVAEAKLMSDKNLSSETLEALSNANVSSLVEGDVSPELKELTQEKMEFIKKLLAEMDQTIPEDLTAIQALIDAQQTQADKNKIAAELAEKIGDFCDKLAQEDYSLMEAEPRCDPEQAPDWLEEFIETDLQKREQEATKDVLSMITQCIEDPRQCDCENIPVESHKQDCIENSALAVRCEYEQDESACNELESKGDKFLEDLPEFMRDVVTERVDQLMEKKEKEMFKKFAPEECIEAGVTTREECEEIMIEKYGPPPEECMENGNFIGEDECKAIMIEKGIPIGPGGEGGQAGMGEGGFGEGMGGGFIEGEFPTECADLSPEECSKLMQEKVQKNIEEIMQGIPEGAEGGMPQISGGYDGKAGEGSFPGMPTSPEELMKQIQTLPLDMKEKIEKAGGMEKLEFMKQYEKDQIGILTPDGMKFVNKDELDKIKEMAGQLKETEPDKFRKLSDEIEKLEKFKEEGKSLEEFGEFKEGFKDEFKEERETGFEKEKMQEQFEEQDESDTAGEFEESEEETEENIDVEPSE